MRKAHGKIRCRTSSLSATARHMPMTSKASSRQWRPASVIPSLVASTACRHRSLRKPRLSAGRLGSPSGFEMDFGVLRMSKVRFAVVGAGWISQEAFLPAVRQTGNAEVTAIVSGNAAKAKRLAEFYGIEDIYDYAEFDAMAASGEVDAIYVATPNSSHCEYTVRAAQHRLHALVEKPLATSTADAESMISAAQAAGVCLMTAYRLHNDPATL